MKRRESIRIMLAGTGALLFGGHAAFAESKKGMVVYKSPTCGCCNAWVKHVRAAGFTVETIDVDDVTPYKTKYGVPLELASCHTGVVAGFAVEGHVPADLIDKLLREKSKTARALVVPGMPMGSPGMEVPGRKDKYDVILVHKNGKRTVYAKR